jgi:GcrA cell cycle regulator
MFANITNSSWTDERVALLKRHFEEGMTCSEIARAMGISRNAVIGKLSRLGLSRPKTASGGLTLRKAAPRGPKIVTQRRILTALRAEPEPAEEIPSEFRCTLLELSRDTCRWPVSGPQGSDIAFCGSRRVDGLPYCAAHARLAYQAGRQRSVRTSAV